MIKRRVRDRIPSQYSDNDQSEHCFIFSRLLRLPSLSHFVSYPKFALPWADRSSRHLNLSHRTPTFIMFGTIILVLSLVNRCCHPTYPSDVLFSRLLPTFTCLVPVSPRPKVYTHHNNIMSLSV